MAGLGPEAAWAEAGSAPVHKGFSSEQRGTRLSHMPGRAVLGSWCEQSHEMPAWPDHVRA